MERRLKRDEKVFVQRLAHIEDKTVLSFILRRGNPARKQISLTFDVGPHAGVTYKLLQILKDENVKATFFVVGFMGDCYPELVKDIHAGGHEIANYSYSHVSLDQVTNLQVFPELRETSEVIKRITGKTTRFFRPPGGDFDRDTVELSALLGLTTVLWTGDPAN